MDLNELDRLEKEMHAAGEARRAGNEGKARVCARRAAAILLDEYFRRNGIVPAETSVIGRLNLFRSLQAISPKAAEIAGHLLLQVDSQRQLPVDIDLIAETRELKGILFPEGQKRE
jgi:hypothetical protein